MGSQAVSYVKEYDMLVGKGSGHYVEADVGRQTADRLNVCRVVQGL